MKAPSYYEIRSRKVIAAGLAAVLLLAFVAVPAVFGETSEAGSYIDITVDEAYKMIKKAHKNLVILDVRNQSEYDLGHLYNAVLIPVYELEDRINELQEHINDPIIVYCKSGYRSQIACEILANNGFTNVYNMLGGITAWMEAGYPIYTTYHHVTVNVLDEEILLQIEPLLLYQAGCTSCGCQSCGQNQNYNITPTITITTLKQNETYTLTLVTYEVNDTAYEVAIAQTLLWNYNEASDEANRTAKFISTQITAEGISLQFYSLSYMVQHAEYNLTLLTTLTPLNSETYNNSFTIVNYVQASKSELKSLEFVEFNIPVTLSRQYVLLGKVAEEIAKVYNKKKDEAFLNLAQSCYTIKEEAKCLSKLVEKQLQEYDKEILKSYSILGIDPEAISNGGFETGDTSYWSVGGSGDHSITNEDRYSGSYSLRLGYKYSANVANSRDWAYQTICLPSYATDIKLSFYYHLFTEDSIDYDWFEVYVRDSSGNNLEQIFKKGGANYPGLEEYGWEQVTYDLSAYAGKTIQIYFAVANWYDTLYKTWCYIDDVSVTYSTCNFWCIFYNFPNCYEGLSYYELTCMASCLLGAWACGPFYWACALYCIGIGCGIVTDAIIIYCLSWVVWYCCLT